MDALVLPAGEAWQALPLAAVREVLASLPVAALPDGPRWLAGLANLRGSIVPVVDPAGVAAEATHFVLADTAAGVAAVVATGAPTPAVLGEPAGAADRYLVDDRVATLLDLDALTAR